MSAASDLRAEYQAQHDAMTQQIEQITQAAVDQTAPLRVQLTALEAQMATCDAIVAREPAEPVYQAGDTGTYSGPTDANGDPNATPATDPAASEPVEQPQ